MIGARFAAGLLLAAGLLVSTPSARAGDTFRLDLPGPDRTPAGAADEDEDDLFTVGYRGVRGGVYGGHRGYSGGHYGGHYGGYRGGYGGYAGHRGGYGGYYGGYRGGYGGYAGYRGGYGGYAGYRGYYGYRSYGYGYGYGFPRSYGYYGYPYSQAYFGSPSVYYGFPSTYYYPSVSIDPCTITGSITALAPSVSLRISPSTTLPGRMIQTPGATLPPPMNPVPGLLPAPESAPGTYPYDGGPRDPVPMPRLEEAPMTSPAPVIRPDPRVVSAVAPVSEGKGKWAYPAYGEAPRRTSFAADREPPARTSIIRPAR